MPTTVNISSVNVTKSHICYKICYLVVNYPVFKVTAKSTVHWREVFNCVFEGLVLEIDGVSECLCRGGFVTLPLAVEGP